MCLRNIQKKLVHGTLIDAEILTSPVPQVFAQPGQDLDTDTPSMWLSKHLPSGLKCSYVSQQTSKKFGAWGPNRCWDIDFSTLLCICLTWPSYQVPMLHPQVCQHLPSGLKCSYVSQKPPKNLVHGALIDAEILTSPLPHVFAQPGQDLGTDTLPVGVPTTSQVSLKMFLCVSETSKKIGAWDPNRCWDIDSPTPPCICSTWPRYGHWCSACGCGNTSPSGLKCSYVSQKPQTKFGAWGPNRCWDIDSPMYLLKLAKIWALILCLWACQHLPSGLKMFLCVSATYKNIWCMGP